ncbi:HdeD family acid-resistance protein [Chamaesiphon sp.]|uniref:HdeD family acid-resistance protein n=1 Tax=Chamaesiphon sp. TaxID=2814140 RepID=UPI003593AB77
MRANAPRTKPRLVSSNWLISLAIVTIGLGILATIFPLFAALDLTLFLGLVFIFAGIIQIFYALQSWGISQVFWKLILGGSYLIAGVFVAIYPLSGIFTVFNLVLGGTIFVQGIIRVSLSLQMRRTIPNWGWMLVSGIIGIIFGIYIWSSSLLSAAWLIGNLIGIDLLFDGIWMLMLPSGQRRALNLQNGVE